MATKRIYEVVNDQTQSRARVVYDDDYDEYRVCVWANGKRLSVADYYTSDRADAIGTANLIVNGSAS